MYPKAERRFLRTNYWAIISLFLVILAGGVVRSTGSGMGCPDWPKCFDRYVPPTDSTQLPAGYEQKYINGRMEKNERFARTLDRLGYGQLAKRIREDESIRTHEEFNAAKTWTEYINRLMGAICGIFLLGCFVFSFTYIKKRKRIFFLSLFNLILVGFQGWLGSIVVSTNLLAWVVTVHMLLALAIVAISIYTYHYALIYRSQSDLSDYPPGFTRSLAIGMLALSLVQITIGTEVRELVDAIASAMNGLGRAAWVERVGSAFNWHRDLAIAVAIGNIWLLYRVRRKYKFNSLQFRYAAIGLSIVFLQALSGVLLAYFALPPAMQASHILLASLLFASQFYLVLLCSKRQDRKPDRVAGSSRRRTI